MKTTVRKAAVAGGLVEFIHFMDRLGRDWWTESPESRNAVFITLGLLALAPDSLELEVPDE